MRAANAYINKEEISQTNNLNKIAKQEGTKARKSKKKGRVRSKVEIHELENRKTIRKTNKTKAVSLKNKLRPRRPR